MADTDLKVIVKAKELATQDFSQASLQNEQPYRECTECRRIAYCDGERQWYHKQQGTPCGDFKEGKCRGG